MSHYQLHKDLYMMPTPAGAYYSVSSPVETPSRRLLFAMLQMENSPLLSEDNLIQYSGLEKNDALAMLYHAQHKGWIEGQDKPQTAPQGMLEDVLPELLPQLSSEDKVMLADTQGFHLGASNFTAETAEQLSALSADIASLHERHHNLLQTNLGLTTSAWSMVDAVGNSQIGFWPMYIGEQRFVLVISGLPYLNQPALTKLVRALSKRYGTFLK